VGGAVAYAQKSGQAQADLAKIIAQFRLNPFSRTRFLEAEPVFSISREQRRSIPV
jgi:hypothetical protein